MVFKSGQDHGGMYHQVLNRCVNKLLIFPNCQIKCDPDGSESRRDGLDHCGFRSGIQGYESTIKETLQTYDENKILHGGHPVLKRMGQNLVMRHDPAGNIKSDKEKSVEKIDGIVALIMGLDPCIRHQTDEGSVYDEGGILGFRMKIT